MLFRLRLTNKRKRRYGVCCCCWRLKSRSVGAKFMAHLSGLHLRECSAALLRRARVNGLKSPEMLPWNDGFWQEEEVGGRGERKKKIQDLSKMQCDSPSDCSGNGIWIQQRVNIVRRVSVSAPVPLHPTERAIISSYARFPFHLTPTFWTKIFLAAGKMGVFFVVLFCVKKHSSVVSY